MLPKKFLECLEHEGIVAIGSCSAGGQVHLVNTWHRFVLVTEDGKLLIPAGGMNKTEENVKANPRVELTLGSHEVMGESSPGVGFLVAGKAEFLDHGELLEAIRAKCGFGSRVLVVTPESCTQTM